MVVAPRSCHDLSVLAPVDRANALETPALVGTVARSASSSRFRRWPVCDPSSTPAKIPVRTSEAGSVEPFVLPCLQRLGVDGFGANTTAIAFGAVAWIETEGMMFIGPRMRSGC